MMPSIMADEKAIDEVARKRGHGGPLRRDSIPESSVHLAGFACHIFLQSSLRLLPPFGNRMNPDNRMAWAGTITGQQPARPPKAHRHQRRYPDLRQIPVRYGSDRRDTE